VGLGAGSEPGQFHVMPSRPTLRSDHAGSPSGARSGGRRGRRRKDEGVAPSARYYGGNEGRSGVGAEPGEQSPPGCSWEWQCGTDHMVWLKSLVVMDTKRLGVDNRARCTRKLGGGWEDGAERGGLGRPGGSQDGVAWKTTVRCVRGVLGGGGVGGGGSRGGFGGRTCSSAQSRSDGRPVASRGVLESIARTGARGR